MKQDKFLTEIEERLEENRRLSRGSWLPEFLKSVTSYLGFNTFRSLVVVSLLATVLMSVAAFDWMISLGRWVFWYK